jgi:3-oxoacyl-[acyl-carrier protein] reductase
MNIDLGGKVALVTGAGRGIGREIARTLAREGVTTVATDVGEAGLGDLAREFAGNGWRGRFCPCDVRDAKRIAEVVEETVGEHGRIDILVNNAGVAGAAFAPGGSSYVEDLAEEDWDRLLDVNLKGTFLMCRAVIPVMKRQRAGRILNAASFAAIVPSVGGAAYAASKAGVVSLTRVLAGELGPWNITVNGYAPGMIPTEMNHFTERPRERQERLLDTLALRRWGEPSDIAGLICFLASDLAGYITGALIDISGGKLTVQMPRVAYERAAQSGEYTFE